MAKFTLEDWWRFADIAWRGTATLFVSVGSAPVVLSRLSSAAANDANPWVEELQREILWAPLIRITDSNTHNKQIIRV